MRVPDNTAADQRWCAGVVRRHARTFSFASRFLPPEKRRAAFAVYAFCRAADDIVDWADPTEPALVARALADRRRMLADALVGRASDALHRELAHAIERFRIPPEPFHVLLDALAADLTPPVYQDWVALSAYCAGVASTVGVMCASIFGTPLSRDAHASAITHARTLGVAMQLTNILRDVGEDAARSRCYLPETDLVEFGISRTEILHSTLRASDPRWRGLMEFEIVRARRLFASAMPGIALLDADARVCARLCATGYAAILGALERAGYDSLTRRARVGGGRKIVLAYRAWRFDTGSGATLRRMEVGA
jgi:phytoene synthase